MSAARPTALSRLQGDGGGAAARAAGVFQSPQHIGGAARSRNACDHIYRLQIVVRQVLAPQFPAVLRTFDGKPKGPVTAGNQTYHHTVVYPESGWALRGIQHTQSSAGTRTQVEQPPAIAESCLYGFHGGGNLGEHCLDGQGNLSIFPVHGRYDLQGTHFVQMHGVGVASLGHHIAQVHTIPPWVVGFCLAGFSIEDGNDNVDRNWQMRYIVS